MEVLKAIGFGVMGLFIVAFGCLILGGLYLAIMSGIEEKERLTKYFYEERGRLPRDNAELEKFMNEPETLPDSNTRAKRG